MEHRIRIVALVAIVVSLGGSGRGTGEDSLARAAMPSVSSGGVSDARSDSSSASGPSSRSDTWSVSETFNCPATSGRVLQVGPGLTYAAPSAAAAAATDGDTILIAAGDYRGDVVSWNASNLTICGIGGRARLFADGNNAQGKGIWVITGNNTTVVNVEFHDATVSDGNGAGIRQQGSNLILINCGFYDNQNGVLTSSGNSTISIQSSEFARNGAGDGYTHNIYVGQIKQLNVVASWFHEARVGHNLKSRASVTTVENSYFADGPNGDSSYLMDFPNGGVVFLRGNLLYKGRNANNSTAVSYGAEGLAWPSNSLTLVHNTLVSDYPGGHYLYAASNTQFLTLTGNLFAGGDGTALVRGFPVDSIAQTKNLTTTPSNLPGAASNHYWPLASVLPQLQLAAQLDPLYLTDAPQPMALRSLASIPHRQIGALQAAP